MRKSEWKDGRIIKQIFGILDDLPTPADRVRVVELLTDPPDALIMKALVASLRCLERAEDRELMLITVHRRYLPPVRPCPVDADDQVEDCDADDCECQNKPISIERRRSEPSDEEG